MFFLLQKLLKLKKRNNFYFSKNSQQSKNKKWPSLVTISNCLLINVKKSIIVLLLANMLCDFLLIFSFSSKPNGGSH